MVLCGGDGMKKNGRKIRNICRGMGSVLDIMPAPSNAAKSGQIARESVLEALRGDWSRVGGDLTRAVASIDNEMAANVQPK